MGVLPSYKIQINLIILFITCLETFCIALLWPDVEAPMNAYSLFISGAIFGITRWISPKKEDFIQNFFMFLLIFGVTGVGGDRLEAKGALGLLFYARIFASCFGFFASVFQIDLKPKEKNE